MKQHQGKTVKLSLLHLNGVKTHYVAILHTWARCARWQSDFIIISMTRRIISCLRELCFRANTCMDFTETNLWVFTMVILNGLSSIAISVSKVHLFVVVSFCNCTWKCKASGKARVFLGGQSHPPTPPPPPGPKWARKCEKFARKIRKKDWNLKKDEESSTLAHLGLRGCLQPCVKLMGRTML